MRDITVICGMILLAAQVVFDVMIMRELGYIHELPSQTTQQEAKAFVAEQLTPFEQATERAGKEAELKRKAGELQEEYFRLHPEQRPPSTPPTPTPGPR